MDRKSIFVLSDDDNLLHAAQALLEGAGHTVATAACCEDALAILVESRQNLVIVDLDMPSPSGLNAVTQVRRRDPEAVVIVATGSRSLDDITAAMTVGAFACLTKPVCADLLRLVVNRAPEFADLSNEVRWLRTSLDRKYGFENIVGRSGSLLYIVEPASRAAQSDAAVLIRGEPGTGKGLLARATHFNSPRKERPFVAVRCDEILKDRIVSQLFGKGENTLAGGTARRGLVEEADGGTLFLDEVGELPLEAQGALLRLVRSGEFTRTGDNRRRIADVRLIAASRKNLLAMIEDAAFREDLYYLLSLLRLELPPLSDRPDDIPRLVRHFLNRSMSQHDRQDLRLPENLMPYFCAYRWPGNVGELEEVVEQAVLLSEGKVIRLPDLLESLRRERPALDSIELDLPPGESAWITSRRS